MSPSVVQDPYAVAVRDAVMDPSAVQSLYAAEVPYAVKDQNAGTIPHCATIPSSLLCVWCYARVCTVRGRLWLPQDPDKRCRWLYPPRV